MNVVWWAVLAGVASTVTLVRAAGWAARVRGGRRLSVRGSERWTSDVLRRFRRQGWRLMRNATLTHGREIDHVAIGPAGVVVVETSWRRSFAMNDLAWAARQARRSAEEVESVLRPCLAAVGVRPVVVTWGRRRPDSVPGTVDGVEVVRGEVLAAWMTQLPGGRLTPADVARAVERLRDATIDHDLYDRREHHIPAGCVAPGLRDSAGSAA